MSRTALARARIVQAWGRILAGYRPNLSIEITRECPLRCPGCYAYGDEHLGGERDAARPRRLQGRRAGHALHGAHRSRIGRCTSRSSAASRWCGTASSNRSCRSWPSAACTRSSSRAPCGRFRRNGSGCRRLQIVVSIDGLQPEHDVRRTPATYDRILKHIEGHQITVHCTVTRQQVRRDGYLEEFLDCWQANPNTRLIWISLYTPQIGEISDGAADDGGSREGRSPSCAGCGRSSRSCRCSTACSTSTPTRRSHRTSASSRRRRSAFRRISSGASRRASSAGNPDCSNCGCIASAGLEAIGRHRLRGGIPVGPDFLRVAAVGTHRGAHPSSGLRPHCNFLFFSFSSFFAPLASLAPRSVFAQSPSNTSAISLTVFGSFNNHADLAPGIEFHGAQALAADKRRVAVADHRPHMQAMPRISSARACCRRASPPSRGCGRRLPP